jgi:hypothetical protein
MKYLFAVAASLLSLPALSQQPSTALFAAPDYPQGYFRDPLDIPMSLAANFGELRPNHYHMGLDIRTQHRENLPVHAAADGYVARIRIEPEGFGQAIYIRHPNGYTTVYGHLNRFFPALAAYVEKEQYRQQSWQVDLAIPAALFPVSKGMLIAYSGSTGGSQGPHLHFEIRQTAGDINLNPLLFGLPVPDRVAPTILRLALYDGQKGIYDQSPQILPVHPIRPQRPPAPGTKTSVEYTFSSPVLTVPVSRIGFAISASDAQSGSANPNGIYRAVLSADNRTVIGFQLDNISYDDTKNINAHIDYKTRLTGGPFLQQLFFLPGYPFPSIYRVPGPAGPRDPAAATVGDTTKNNNLPLRPDDGFVDLSDGELHDIRIDITDPQGNKGWLSFAVRYRAVATAAAVAKSLDPAAAVASSSDPAEVPAPAPATAKTFYPHQVDGLETADFAFYLTEKSLYDSARIDATLVGYPSSGLSLPDGVSPVCSIGARWIPLLDPVLVRLHLPDSSAGLAGQPATDRDRVVMVCFQGNDKEVQHPEWQGSWASARFREFGNYQLVSDTVAPVILPIGPLDGADLGHARRIAFHVRDNLGAIRRFRAELDGQWLCFTNDKGLAYIYSFDRHCPPGPHTLRISVEDVAGNRSQKEYHFTR